MAKAGFGIAPRVPTLSLTNAQIDWIMGWDDDIPELESIGKKKRKRGVEVVDLEDVVDDDDRHDGDYGDAGNDSDATNQRLDNLVYDAIEDDEILDEDDERRWAVMSGGLMQDDEEMEG